MDRGLINIYNAKKYIKIQEKQSLFYYLTDLIQIHLHCVTALGLAGIGKVNPKKKDITSTGFVLPSWV